MAVTGMLGTCMRAAERQGRTLEHGGTRRPRANPATRSYVMPYPLPGSDVWVRSGRGGHHTCRYFQVPL